MGIIVGSARIDENGHISGGKAGDQTGNEVSTQSFYMHKKGWYRLRLKSAAHANAIAKAMKEACGNDNIGYDQTNRAAMSMVKKYGSLGAVAERSETDCSDLARACIYQATGVDVGAFSTGDEASVLERSGLFESRVSVHSSDDVMNGDILVTKSKGHTVVVVSGRSRGGNSSSTDSTYDVGSVYEVLVNNLNVRTGAGKNYPKKKKSELSTDGQKHSNDNGQYMIGTRVTCKEHQVDSNGNTWMRTPSGWLAAYYNGKKYIG